MSADFITECPACGEETLRVWKDIGEIWLDHIDIGVRTQCRECDVSTKYVGILWDVRL